jgi:ATP-dependent RNA helicase DeaD
MQRAQLPAPEDLAEDTGPPRRDERARAPRERVEHRSDRKLDHKPDRKYEPLDRDNSAKADDRRRARPVHDHGRDMVWFRVDIGRERNADPRWLLPLLCRAGDVTKAEVGAIRIFDRDTRFQIAAEFADKFADAARSTKPNEARISRIGASMGDDVGARSKPPHAGRPRNNDEAKAETSPDPETVPRAKTPWRDRSNGKAGSRPHRKGDSPRFHANGSKPYAGPSKAHGAHDPAAKFAHKKKPKKHRAPPQG